MLSLCSSQYREGAYYLPNDEAEQARLDLLHHIYLLGIDGELHLSPLKTVKRCLDFGTGTGLWVSRKKANLKQPRGLD